MVSKRMGKQIDSLMDRQTDGEIYEQTDNDGQVSRGIEGLTYNQRDGQQHR